MLTIWVLDKLYIITFILNKEMKECAKSKVTFIKGQKNEPLKARIAIDFDCLKLLNFIDFVEL